LALQDDEPYRGECPAEDRDGDGRSFRPTDADGDLRRQSGDAVGRSQVTGGLQVCRSVDKMVSTGLLEWIVSPVVRLTCLNHRPAKATFAPPNITFSAAHIYCANYFWATYFHEPDATKRANRTAKPRCFGTSVL
jgi:hypothetical protein